MMRLAVDVATPSGIDRAAVESALGVAATELRVLLVGDAAVLSEHVDGHPAAGHVDVVAADDVIAPGEDADRVVRGRAGASVRVAMDLARAGHADAVASVASGPVVAAAAAFVLGRLRGHRRPVLAAEVDGVTIVDAGAAATATTSDLAVAAAAVAGEGARIGLLHPVGPPGPRLDEFAALVATRVAGVDQVRAVDVDAALDGSVDVVACPGALGATLVGAAAGSHAVSSLFTVVGVPAVVGAVRSRDASSCVAALRELVAPGRFRQGEVRGVA